MKQGWETKKLDDVCEVEYGTRVVHKRDGGSKYPVYGGGGATFFMDEYNREDRMVIARFAMSEQCTRFVKGKFFLNDSGLTVTPKNKSEIREDFFDYLIFSLNDHIYSLGRGTAQKNLDVPAFRNIDISYPKSLPEQERIVSLLDEIFAGLAHVHENAERNLVNAREVFEAALRKVFSDNNKKNHETTIGEQITLQRGFDITKSQQEKGNVPVVSSGGIKSYHNIPMAKGPGVVIGRKGTLGKSYYVVEDYWPHDTTLWVKDFKGNDPRLVYYLFKVLDVSKLDSGAANPALNRNIVHPIKIFWPEKTEQRAIVGRLDRLAAETSRLEGVYQSKLDAVEELRKSVLGKVFAGEL
ncbi:MAG: restriction endonuclease subunit S [Anaerolineales bacterium]|nr:restriction endonuclease subunit S [Anaerolineales bacterium]